MDATPALRTEEALATIDRLSRFEEPLRRRAEGLSWLVWGLATATVLLANRYLDSAPWQIGAVTMGMVWPAVGILATSAVWRLAGVTRSTLAPSMRRVAVVAFAAIAATFLLAELGYQVYVWTGSYVLMGAVLGALPWGFLGLVQWARMTRDGRRATLVGGLGMAVAMAVWMQFFLSEGEQANYLFLVFVAAGLPALLGLAWVFRR